MSEEADWELIPDVAISTVKEYSENYISGNPKTVWQAGISNDGEYLLHGEQSWFYEDGKIQWEVNWFAGKKVGVETYWNLDGKIISDEFFWSGRMQ